jgi:hypothetical protein
MTLQNNREGASGMGITYSHHLILCMMMQRCTHFYRFIFPYLHSISPLIFLFSTPQKNYIKYNKLETIGILFVERWLDIRKDSVHFLLCVLQNVFYHLITVAGIDGRLFYLTAVDCHDEGDFSGLS